MVPANWSKAVTQLNDWEELERKRATALVVLRLGNKNSKTSEDVPCVARPVVAVVELSGGN